MSDAIKKLKTDEKLLAQLAGARAPSRKEVEQQRVSFVYGLLDEKAHITKEQVKKYAERISG